MFPEDTAGRAQRSRAKAGPLQPGWFSLRTTSRVGKMISPLIRALGSCSGQQKAEKKKTVKAHRFPWVSAKGEKKEKKCARKKVRPGIWSRDRGKALNERQTTIWGFSQLLSTFQGWHWSTCDAEHVTGPDLSPLLCTTALHQLPSIPQPSTRQKTFRKPIPSISATELLGLGTRFQH